MKPIFLISLLFCLLKACSNGGSEGAVSASAKAPVHITHINRGSISDSVSLSATTYYLSTNEIVAPVSGYITKAGVRPGDEVTSGQVLFEIKTREASALQAGLKDTALSGLGSIQIKAPSDGQLASVSHVTDDYVQEGGELARLVQSRNLYLKLYVPHEYRNVVQKGEQIDVRLPDGKRFTTTVTGRLNQADASTQSVVWLLKPDGTTTIPEGLMLSVAIPTASHTDVQLLPKQAVLADETLDSFWVMKVIHDSLAVRVPIQKGIETANQVEVLEPEFSPSDQIIISGQYGLEDSSLVQISKPER